MLDAINNASLPHNIKQIFIENLNTNNDYILWLNNIYKNHDEILSSHIDRILEKFNENLFEYIISITEKENSYHTVDIVDTIEKYISSYIEEDFLNSLILAIDKAIYELDDTIDDLEDDLENCYYEEYSKHELIELINLYETQLDFLFDMTITIKNIKQVKIEHIEELLQ